MCDVSVNTERTDDIAVLTVGKLSPIIDTCSAFVKSKRI